MANAEGNSVIVIEAEKAVAGATIDVGGAPEFIAADGKGRAWVNVADKNEVAAIDLKTEKLLGAAPIAGCKEPTALTIDPRKGRLFVGCRNRVMAIVDTANLQELATLPIGEHVDAAAFDPQSGLAFASTGEGILTIIRERAPGQYEIAANVSTMRTAKTMAFDPATGNVYLPAVEGAPPGATGPPKASGPGAYKAGPFVVLVMAK